MEQAQEKKFVCKFCNKRYPCGKSLGGHIRTHMNNNNNNNNGNNCGESESDELISINKLLSNGRITKRPVTESETASEADGQSAGTYVLRDNPKKTKRFFSDSSANGSLLKEMICRECGKGFHSLKALCGHMACHSEKERIFVEKQKQLIMDSQSDTETSSTPSKRRRSKRIRYNKTIGVYDSNNNSMANGSSSVSEIEQEQEEVAMCLMMLSRGSSGYCKKKGLNSIGNHSLDNNSVILEAKSSSIDVRITINNGDKYLKMKKQRENNKFKPADHQSGTLSDESSDSLYFRNGPSTEDFDAKYGKGLSKFKSLNNEFPKDKNKNQANRGFNMYDLRRSNANNDCYSHDAFCNNSPKGSKYECLTCNKAFDSHRALGGHRANHTKANEYCNDATLAADDGFIVPMTDNNNKLTKSSKTISTTRFSSSSNAEKRLGSKKNKGHQCPFCFRVFKSGQALGGHKRSHFVGGGSEDRTLVIKQDSSEMTTATVIDLNLPAPVEDDAIGNVGFMPWEI